MRISLLVIFALLGAAALAQGTFIQNVCTERRCIYCQSAVLEQGACYNTTNGMSAQNFCGTEFLHMVVYPFSQDCTQFSTPQEQQLGVCDFVATSNFVEFQCPSGAMSVQQKLKKQQHQRVAEAHKSNALIALKYPVIVPARSEQSASMPTPLLTTNNMKAAKQIVRNGELRLSVRGAFASSALEALFPHNGRPMPSLIALDDAENVSPVPAGAVVLHLGSDGTLQMLLQVSPLHALAENSKNLVIRTEDGSVEIASLRL